MVDSTWWSGDVVGECAAGAAEPVVEVDAGGEGEQALQDAGAQVVESARSVAFEREQVLGRPVDRFDALADRCAVWAAVGLVGSGGADEHGAEVVDGGGELAAGVALVGDHGLPAAQGAGQQLERDLALGAIGADEADGARGAVEPKGGVQAHPKEEAAVAAAVAVAGRVGDR